MEMHADQGRDSEFSRWADALESEPVEPWPLNASSRIGRPPSARVVDAAARGGPVLPDPGDALACDVRLPVDPRRRTRGAVVEYLPLQPVDLLPLWRTPSGRRRPGRLSAGPGPPEATADLLVRMCFPGRGSAAIAAIRGRVGGTVANRGDCPLVARSVHKLVVSSGSTVLPADTGVVARM